MDEQIIAQIDTDTIFIIISGKYTLNIQAAYINCDCGKSGQSF